MKKKTATAWALERVAEEVRAGQFKTALGKVACPGCGSVIEISPWNKERFMFICNNMMCGLWHKPMPDFSLQ